MNKDHHQLVGRYVANNQPTVVTTRELADETGLQHIAAIAALSELISRRHLFATITSIGGLGVGPTGNLTLVLPRLTPEGEQELGITNYSEATYESCVRAFHEAIDTFISQEQLIFPETGNGVAIVAEMLNSPEVSAAIGPLLGLTIQILFRAEE